MTTATETGLVASGIAVRDLRSPLRMVAGCAGLTAASDLPILPGRAMAKQHVSHGR